MTVFKGQPIQHPANELLICSSMLTHHRLTHSPPLVLAWPVTGVDSGESVSGHSLPYKLTHLFSLLPFRPSVWCSEQLEPGHFPRTQLNPTKDPPEPKVLDPSGLFPRTHLNPIKDPPEPPRTLRTPLVHLETPGLLPPQKVRYVLPHPLTHGHGHHAVT